MTASVGPGLSLREYECLRLYAQVGSQKIVAKQMYVSRQTVKNFLSAAYRKLEVGSALEAFKRLGWLRVPDEGTPEEAKFRWQLVEV